MAPPIANGSLLVPLKVKNAYLKAAGLGSEESPEASAEVIEEAEEHAGLRKSAVGEDCPV